MTNPRFAFYDFETNGKFSVLTQPIEVAAKILEPNGKIIDYHSFVSCKFPLSITTEKINGITDEMLAKSGRPIKEVFTELNELFDVPETIYVGCNILRFDNLFYNNFANQFDFKRIQQKNCFDIQGQFKAELLGLVKDPNMSWGDFHSICLSRPLQIRHRLSDMCEHYKIKPKGNFKVGEFTPVDREKTFHSAPFDVDRTYKVFLKQWVKINKHMAKEPITTLVKSGC